MEEPEKPGSSGGSIACVTADNLLTEKDKRRRTYENRKLQDGPARPFTSTTTVPSENIVSRYDRTRKLKVVKDYCGINDVFESSKSLNKQMKKKLDVIPSTSNDLILENVNDEEPLTVEIPDDNIEVSKVLKLVSNKSPQFSPDSSCQMKPLKTYVNRKKQSGFVEDFDLPEYPEELECTFNSDSDEDEHAGIKIDTEKYNRLLKLHDITADDELLTNKKSPNKRRNSPRKKIHSKPPPKEVLPTKKTQKSKFVHVFRPNILQTSQSSASLSEEDKRKLIAQLTKKIDEKPDSKHKQLAQKFYKNIQPEEKRVNEKKSKFNILSCKVIPADSPNKILPNTSEITPSNSDTKSDNIDFEELITKQTKIEVKKSSQETENEKLNTDLITRKKRKVNTKVKNRTEKQREKIIEPVTEQDLTPIDDLNQIEIFQDSVPVYDNELMLQVPLQTLENNIIIVDDLNQVSIDSNQLTDGHIIFVQDINSSLLTQGIAGQPENIEQDTLNEEECTEQECLDEVEDLEHLNQVENLPQESLDEVESVSEEKMDEVEEMSPQDLNENEATKIEEVQNESELKTLNEIDQLSQKSGSKLTIDSDDSIESPMFEQHVSVESPIFKKEDKRSLAQKIIDFKVDVSKIDLSFINIGLKNQNSPVTVTDIKGEIEKIEKSNIDIEKIPCKTEEIDQKLEKESSSTSEQKDSQINEDNDNEITSTTTNEERTDGPKEFDHLPTFLSIKQSKNEDSEVSSTNIEIPKKDVIKINKSLFSQSRKIKSDIKSKKSVKKPMQTTPKVNKKIQKLPKSEKKLSSIDKLKSSKEQVKKRSKSLPNIKDTPKGTKITVKLIKNKTLSENKKITKKTSLKKTVEIPKPPEKSKDVTPTAPNSVKAKVYLVKAKKSIKKIKKENPEEITETSKPLETSKKPTFENELKVGMIVWSRVGTHPYWPSIITNDPYTNVFKKNGIGRAKIACYHVNFFGDHGRRSWIKSTHMFKYISKKDFIEKANQSPKKIKNLKEPFHPSAFFVSYAQKSKWDSAVEEADGINKQPIIQRVELFCELLEKEKQEKSAEKTKPIERRKYSINEPPAKKIKIDPDIEIKEKEISEADLDEVSLTKRKQHQTIETTLDEIPLLQRVSTETKTNKEPLAKRKLRLSEIKKESKEDLTELKDSRTPSPSPSPLTVVNKKKSLFKGVAKERVCQICLKPDKVMRCRGCNGAFHVKCDKENKIIDVEDSKPLDIVLNTEGSDTSLSTRASDDILNNIGCSNEIKIENEEIGSQDILNCSDEIKLESPQDPEIKQEVLTPEKPKLTISEQIDLKMKEVMEGLLDHTKYAESTSDDSSSESEDTSVKTEPEEKNTPESVKMIKHVTADGVIHKFVEETLKENNFKCTICLSGTAPCFVCSNIISKSGDQKREKCSVFQCGKYYHRECLKDWPQTKWMYSNKKYKETLACPYHTCHTCISDDPRSASSRFTNDKLTKCIRCPSTYHPSCYCLPAGSTVLSGSQIICPKHYVRNKIGKSTKHVNTSWCFICSIGGSLICCENCPASFHAECLKLSPPEGSYICEECESGRLPLYNEIVWVKLGNYRWWPSIILYPSEIPDNVKNSKHSTGDFVVRFFGSHDHYWVNRGRVFLFEDGDSGHIGSRRSSVDFLFMKAMQEARDAHRTYQSDRESYTAENRVGMKPPHYVKIKFNRPVGTVRLQDGNTSNTTPCYCDPKGTNPCGPDSDCLNRLLLTECNPMLCPAGDRCCNQSFEKRLYAPVVPFNTSGRGWGLRSQEPIARGTFVIEYVGEVIDEGEYQRRVTRKHEHKDENYYFLTIEKDRMIDAGPKGNLARFMNHSCSPNCETQKWTVNGDTRVGLFAITDIAADTELTFNYNLECIGEGKKVCKCAAPNCSGYIGKKVKQDEKMKKIKSKKQKKAVSSACDVAVETPSLSCFSCGRAGAVQPCSHKDCDRCYHLECVNLTSRQEDGWQCPCHSCKVCSKRTTRSCFVCTSSYCSAHSKDYILYDSTKYVCREHYNVPTKKKRSSLTSPDKTEEKPDETDIKKEEKKQKNKVELNKSDNIEIKNVSDTEKLISESSKKNKKVLIPTKIKLTKKSKKSETKKSPQIEKEYENAVVKITKLNKSELIAVSNQESIEKSLKPSPNENQSNTETKSIEEVKNIENQLENIFNYESINKIEICNSDSNLTSEGNENVNKKIKGKRLPVRKSTRFLNSELDNISFVESPRVNDIKNEENLSSDSENDINIKFVKSKVILKNVMSSEDEKSNNCEVLDSKETLKIDNFEERKSNIQLVVDKPDIKTKKLGVRKSFRLQEQTVSDDNLQKNNENIAISDTVSEDLSEKSENTEDNISEETILKSEDSTIRKRGRPKKKIRNNVHSEKLEKEVTNLKVDEKKDSNNEENLIKKTNKDKLKTENPRKTKKRPRTPETTEGKNLQSSETLQNTEEILPPSKKFKKYKSKITSKEKALDVLEDDKKVSEVTEQIISVANNTNGSITEENSKGKSEQKCYVNLEILKNIKKDSPTLKKLKKTRTIKNTTKLSENLEKKSDGPTLKKMEKETKKLKKMRISKILVTKKKLLPKNKIKSTENLKGKIVEAKEKVEENNISPKKAKRSKNIPEKCEENNEEGIEKQEITEKIKKSSKRAFETQDTTETQNSSGITETSETNKNDLISKVEIENKDDTKTSDNISKIPEVLQSSGKNKKDDLSETVSSDPVIEEGVSSVRRILRKSTVDIVKKTIAKKIKRKKFKDDNSSQFKTNLKIKNTKKETEDVSHDVKDVNILFKTELKNIQDNKSEQIESDAEKHSEKNQITDTESNASDEISKKSENSSIDLNSEITETKEDLGKVVRKTQKTQRKSKSNKSDENPKKLLRSHTDTKIEIETEPLSEIIEPKQKTELNPIENIKSPKNQIDMKEVKIKVELLERPLRNRIEKNEETDKNEDKIKNKDKKQKKSDSSDDDVPEKRILRPRIDLKEHSTQPEIKIETKKTAKETKRPIIPEIAKRNMREENAQIEEDLKMIKMSLEELNKEKIFENEEIDKKHEKDEETEQHDKKQNIVDNDEESKQEATDEDKELPRKRGRPKKSLSQPEDDVEERKEATDEDKELPRKRGRPKKLVTQQSEKLNIEKHLRIVLNKSAELDNRSDNQLVKTQDDIEKDLPVRKRIKLRSENLL